MNWRSSASDKSLPRSRKTPFDLGCSRDTSRGCVGLRCTVLSYTFRSHPYQNTVERGCCSKVFFGLRNNDAGPSCEPAIHPEGNAIHGLVEGTISSEMERSVRRVSFAASTPSGKTCFSPDEMTLRALPSGQSRDPPDGMPLRLAHQNHFGSQCATERVYRYLLAKVELKKSHFGKPPLTECVLRHPLCQSELAELRERQKPATKSKNTF